MARLFAILTLLAVVLCPSASDSRFKPLELPGLHNVFAVQTNLFSGSSPENDDAFRALRDLGIKTIISVDGAKPEVERAQKFGLQYIHLPHGYDGISRETQLKLTKATQVAEGPIYIHCHHGKHRGPAALAVVCMSENNWTHDEAEAWLHAAGTATNYTGLFKTVREFQIPTTNELAAIPSKFPATQESSRIVDAMVAIDYHYESLQRSQPAAAAATLLREQFRELQRLEESKKLGTSFLKALSISEKLAESLERDLTAGNAANLQAAVKTLKNDCATCHKKFRD